MIEHKVLEHISMLMEQDMKVNGLKISSMAKELRNGLMEPSIPASISAVRRKVEVNLFGVMVPHTRVNSRITI